jgi:hypothetical protein
MKTALLALAVAGCATDAPAPEVVADHLAMPADLQVVGDQVYSLQYVGSIVAISTRDHAMRTIVPAMRPVAANEIPVDLDTYNLVVTGDAIYWTSNASGMPQVLRAGLDGSGATVLDQGLAPFHALVATESGVCWAGELSITCEHGVVAAGVAEPHAMVANGSMLYFATPSSMHRLGGAHAQGDGGLYSVPLAGGAVQMIATGLDDVRALVITDDAHMLWTDGGTFTCEQQLCTPNLDASLHTFSLAEPDGGARVISDGYASIEDGLTVAGDRVYFDSEARLRSRSLRGIEVAGAETLVSPATLACRALGVAGGELYCASDDAIEAIGY